MKKLIAIFMLVMMISLSYPPESEAAWGLFRGLWRKITGTGTGQAGGGVSKVGASCNIYEQNAAAAADSLPLAYSTTLYYGGQDLYQPAANISVCKVSMNVNANGNITGLTFYAEIWTLVDTWNLNAKVGTTSTGVVGVNSWLNTWVDFEWATPVSISTGTNYAIVIYTDGCCSTTNYLTLNKSTAGGFQGISCKFTNAGIADCTTYDALIKVYNQ